MANSKPKVTEKRGPKLPQEIVREKVDNPEVEPVEEAAITRFEPAHHAIIEAFPRGTIADDAAESVFATLREDLGRIPGVTLEGEAVPFEVIFGANARAVVDFTKLEARASMLRNQAALTPVNLRISVRTEGRNKSVLSKLCTPEDTLKYVELFAAGYQAGSTVSPER